MNNDSEQVIELFFFDVQITNIPANARPRVMFCKTDRASFYGYEKFDELRRVGGQKINDYKPSITYKHIYEKKQDLTIQIIDLVQGGILDELSTTLNEIMCSPNHVLEKHFSKSGPFTIRADVRKQVNGKNSMIYWKRKGKKIKNMDGWFGISDPFLRFFKLHESQNWLMVHETEFIKNNESPIWKEFGIPADRLFNDPNIPFKVELWDNEKNNKHQYIGDFTTTFNEIVNQRKLSFEAKTQNDKLGGIVEIQTLVLPPLQIKLTLGMDFQQNEFGIHSELSNFYQYNCFLVDLFDFFFKIGAEEKLNFYGFGGFPKFFGLVDCPNVSGFGGFPKVSLLQGDIIDNCFALNGNIQNPSVERSRIFETYQRRAKNIILANNGCIGPIIKKQMEQIQSLNELETYNVLIILVHGSISNIEESLNLLPEASHLPLSIFIIGVGKGDFSAVEKFVSEAKTQKKQMARKIVNYCQCCDFYVDEFTKVNLLKKLHKQIIQYAEMSLQENIRKIQCLQ